MGKIVQIRTPEGATELDPRPNQLIIAQPDGGVILRDLQLGLGAAMVEPDEEDDDFDENLAKRLSDSELASVATDLLEAIRDDWNSSANRRDLIAQAIKLLGITVEEPQARTDNSAVGGQSKIRSPLLLEAVLAFQANAVAELLPASGPVKVRFDGHDGENEEAMMACENLEKDLNHYLTTTASEYYPDTTRMLFDNVGLAGSGFKKIFHCPIRRRPVSESVATDNLIINAGATDLKNADRITEKWTLSQVKMTRLQARGYYRKCNLGPPASKTDVVETAKNVSQGLYIQTSLPANYRHNLYTTYCYLDNNALVPKDLIVQGLALPFRVTIDEDSQQILEIRRDWNENDEVEYERRQTFVKFPFVEAMGFYGLGLMHILGNTTNSMTAAWRILLDAGMFSSFPGWLYAKDALKGQDTNSFIVGVGEGKGIQTGGRPIGDMIMPLPYKEASPTFIQLANLITEAGQRLGSTTAIQVGEGSQQAPVGTTLALLEQAQKMMMAVHKGLHAAQSEEFQLLKDRFRENPEAFWAKNRKPSQTWNEETLLAALDNGDIVPSADPNTPSHMHRVMRVVALVQLATAFGQLFGSGGTTEVAKTAIRVLGYDPTPYLQPDPPHPAEPPDPVGMAAVEAKAKADAEKNQTELIRTKMETTSREKIEAAKLGQKHVSEGQQLQHKANSEALGRQHEQASQQQANQNEQTKMIAEHVREMQKLRQQASMQAMKQLGFGQRVI